MRPCVPGLVFVARFLIASSVSFPVIGLFSFSIFSVFRHYRLCASMSLCVSYRLTRFWCIIVMAFSLWTYMLNHVQLFATPWAVACQAPLSVGFSRQEYWGGLPFLLQGVFLTQGSSPHPCVSCTLQVDSLPLSHLGSPWTWVHTGDWFEMRSLETGMRKQKHEKREYKIALS